MADVIGGIEAQLSSNDAGLEAGFAKARQAMAAIESQIRQLTAEEKKGAIGTADYAAKVAELQAAQARLTAAMAGAAGRTNALNTAMTGIATGAKFNAMSMLYLGQAVDDLQYGFSAIVNQVPMLAMSFGMNAGLAGGLSIAAVAASQLITRWGGLMDKLGVGIPTPALEGLEKVEHQLKEVGKRIDELRAKPRLDLAGMIELGHLTGEQARLKGEEKAGKELEDITGGLSKGERERGGAFKEAVAEGGGKAALDDLTAALAKRVDEAGKVAVLGATGGTERAVTEDLRRRAKPDMFGNVDEAARREMEEIRRHNAAIGTPQKVAEELFRNAAKGDEAAIRSIRDAIGKGTKFAAGVEKADPDEIARKREQETEREMRHATGKGDKFAAEEKKRNDQSRRDDAKQLREAIGRGDLAADEELRKRREQDAMDKLPALGDRAEREYADILGQTAGPEGLDVKAARDELQERLAGEFEAAGMGKDEAEKKAKEMARETARGVNDDIARKMMEPGRSSQQYGVADIVRTAQAAVTGGDPSLQKLDDIKDELARILKQVGGIKAPAVRAQRNGR